MASIPADRSTRDEAVAGDGFRVFVYDSPKAVVLRIRGRSNISEIHVRSLTVD